MLAAARFENSPRPLAAVRYKIDVALFGHETLRSIHGAIFGNFISHRRRRCLVRRFDSRKHPHESGVENRQRMADDRSYVTRPGNPRLAPAPGANRNDKNQLGETKFRVIRASLKLCSPLEVSCCKDRLKTRCPGFACSRRSFPDRKSPFPVAPLCDCHYR